jgi:hypothetical protein
MQTFVRIFYQKFLLLSREKQRKNSKMVVRRVLVLIQVRNKNRLRRVLVFDTSEVILFLKK